MMMWYSGWEWGGWLLMTVVMVLFWAVVITAVVAAIRYATGRSAHSLNSGPSHAEDLLTERFARGEIDVDEFRQRQASLREHR